MSTVKDEAKDLIDRLPDEATWEDILYELYVRQKVEKGLRDAEQGRMVSHDEVKERFIVGSTSFRSSPGIA